MYAIQCSKRMIFICFRVIWRELSWGMFKLQLSRLMRKGTLAFCGLCSFKQQSSGARFSTLCLRLALVPCIVWVNHEGSSSAVSPEPSLFPYLISTIFTWSGSSALLNLQMMPFYLLCSLKGILEKGVDPDQSLHLNGTSKQQRMLSFLVGYKIELEVFFLQWDLHTISYTCRRRNIGMSVASKIQKAKIEGDGNP